MPPDSTLLNTQDHSRSSVGLVYVYPVVSRRAGGVSIGINLNPNNACNWRCIYCQVPDLTRGGPPPIDLRRLQTELDHMLDDLLLGDFLVSRVPEGQRRLVDFAFSGNGEPTSAREFSDAVHLVVDTMVRRDLLPHVKLRLITNGSLLDRKSVRDGIARIGAAGGEVWFKVDSARSEAATRINGVQLRVETTERRLRACCRLCPTWIQTCLFAVDGQLPGERDISELTDLFVRCREEIRGIHLYGLARPSAQPEASRLTPVPTAWLEAVGAKLRDQGLTVEVSP